MEATEIINPNGDIERTIVLNEEESNQILNNIAPEQRETVMQHLNRIAQNTPQISAEELERICDEAVGITTTVEDNQSIIEPVDYEEPESTVEALEALEEEQSIAEDFHERVEDAINQEEPLAPIVYNTQFSSVTTTRFSGAEWFNNISEQVVLIGGAGGISSWLALLLSRTNVQRLLIFDNDKVEAVNLAGQFFKYGDIGQFKVSAVGANITEFSNYYRTNYYTSRYDSRSPVLPVMMCGFDNMEARKIFFNKWYSCVRSSFTPEKCLLLDGRLSAETFQVLCIQGDDNSAIEEYKNRYLFDDSMADATPCSYKQTSFMANMIAATMVNIFVNWCANNIGSFRPVPFFTEYDAVTMQYKIKMNAV